MPLELNANEDALILGDADAVTCGTAVFRACFERTTSQYLDQSGVSLTVRDTALMLPERSLPAAVVRDALCTVRGHTYRVREVQDADTNGWVKVILAEA